MGGKKTRSQNVQPVPTSRGTRIPGLQVSPVLCLQRPGAGEGSPAGWAGPEGPPSPFTEHLQAARQHETLKRRNTPDEAQTECWKGRKGRGLEVLSAVLVGECLPWPKAVSVVGQTGKLKSSC